VLIGVLGPVAAWDATGTPLPLKGPRHRAVLARLAVARGRVVPLGVLIDDLWEIPPARAAGSVRTFVADLRRVLETGKPHEVLVTEGPGYALRAETDADRFTRLAGPERDAGPGRTLEVSGEGLDLWRGPAYGEFTDEPWARAEAERLTELRHALTERRAETLLAAGRPADAVPGLRAHAAGQPWREDAHRLLALALYRSGRQADALEVIRGFRERLADDLGLDAGPELSGLEAAILRRDPVSGPGDRDVLAATAAAYQRAGGALTRTRLESAAALAGSLALGGGSGLPEAMSQRLAAIEAASRLDDPVAVARVIAGFAVPAIWTRPDDPALAARIVAAASRTLAELPDGAEPLRARLLATIALESRGTSGTRPREAAERAETIARRLGDPALLLFALAGTWMQSFWRTGLAGVRDDLGQEIVTLAARHGLPDFEILGRLVRMQALGALGDFAAAGEQARTLEELSRAGERPGVTVFTTWFRAMDAVADGRDTSGEGYRHASSLLEGCGMPGVARGLPPLALLCLRVWRRDPASGFGDGTGWGPYRPWARPHLLLAAARRDEAARALRECPDPPPGVLAEALWCLTARAAVVLDDGFVARAAREALLPASGEIAGAASGMLTAGPVRDYLDDMDRTDVRGP